MDKSRFQRSAMLFGQSGMEKLSDSHIAVFGIGGVGGHAAEALVRSGVGHLDLIDADSVSLSNLNRQIIATEKTVGMSKVEAARDRFLSLNPDIKLSLHNCFFSSENSSDFDFSSYDYVVDAIDTVSSKIELILCSQRAGTSIISSMGTGNKLDPTQLEISDIYKTSVCPLARVMRYELKKRGVKGLKVVYSRELPIKPESIDTADICTNEEADSDVRKIKKIPPGSNSFVPGTAGLIIASEIIKDILKKA